MENAIKQAIALDNWMRESFIKLHQDPEIAFEEVQTSKWVAQELTALGYQVTQGIGQTGIAAWVKNGPGATVAFRADMDCNAVKETTGLPYASTKVIHKDGQTVPLAHACGHDAHTVWLVALAKVMMATKDTWSGTLVLVAQPAEETFSGAKAMVADGLWKIAPEPDYLLGQHTAPYPTGMYMSGDMLLAGSDSFEVTMHGIGAHGSTPHLSVDSALMASTAIVQLQSIISRNVDPVQMGIVSVGMIHAGMDANVLPANATFKINTRWFKDEVRDKINSGINRIVNSVAEGFGAPEKPTITHLYGTTPLINSADLVTNVIIKAINEGVTLPNQVIYPVPPATGGEDCHLLVSDLPKAKVGFTLVGTCPPPIFEAAKAKGMTFPWANHNPNYQVDLNALVYGASSAVAATFALLKK
jgi:amidohydrolase